MQHQPVVTKQPKEKAENLRKSRFHWRKNLNKCPVCEAKPGFDELTHRSPLGKKAPPE